MPRRTILVPTIDANAPARESQPDFLGVKVNDYRVKVNYRDCMKVIVSDDQRTLDTLAARSREHFERAWPRRITEEE